MNELSLYSRLALAQDWMTEPQDVLFFLENKRMYTGKNPPKCFVFHEHMMLDGFRGTRFSEPNPVPSWNEVPKNPGNGCILDTSVSIYLYLSLSLSISIYVYIYIYMSIYLASIFLYLSLSMTKQLVPGCDRVMPGSSCAISCRSPWTGEQADGPDLVGATVWGLEVRFFLESG